MIATLVVGWIFVDLKIRMQFSNTPFFFSTQSPPVSFIFTVILITLLLYSILNNLSQFSHSFRFSKPLCLSVFTTFVISPNTRCHYRNARRSRAFVIADTSIVRR